MKILTKIQRDVLKFYFFKDENFPNWESIANKLLESGRAIVAGNKNIWVGGIGNFISISPAVDAVDCSQYKFDLDSFLKSKWFEEWKNLYIDDLKEEIQELSDREKDIINL